MSRTSITYRPNSCLDEPQMKMSCKWSEHEQRRCNSCKLRWDASGCRLAVLVFRLQCKNHSRPCNWPDSTYTTEWAQRWLVIHMTPPTVPHVTLRVRSNEYSIMSTSLLISSCTRASSCSAKLNSVLSQTPKNEFFTRSLQIFSKSTLVVSGLLQVKRLINKLIINK